MPNNSDSPPNTQDFIVLPIKPPNPPAGTIRFFATGGALSAIDSGGNSALSGGVTSVATLASALPCVAGVTVVQLNVAPFTIFRCVAPLDGGANFFVPDSYPNNVIDPMAYGCRFNSHISAIPTFTNASNVITCADCNFTGLDYLGRPIARIGQQVFGTNATNDTSQASSTVILAQTTILAIDSATQIRTVGNATATTSASGFLAWGDRDTAPAASVQSVSNDPMFAAWTAAATNCLPLVMPGGIGWFEQPEWNTFPAVGGCGTSNSVTNTRRGFSVQGQGPNETIVLIAPSLDPTKCTGGPAGHQIGCYASGPNMYLKGFQLHGLGNSAPGAGFNGKSLVFLSGFSPGINFQVDSVYIFGFGANQGNGQIQAGSLTGLNVGDGINQGISGGTISNSIVEAAGSVGVYLHPGAGGTTNIGLVNFWVAVCRTCLVMDSGVISSSNGLYGFTFGAVSAYSGSAVVISAGGAGASAVIFNSANDAIPYATTVSAGAAQLNICPNAGGANCGAKVNLTNTEIINTSAGNSGIFYSNGAELSMSNVFLQAPFGIVGNGSGGNCVGNGACKIHDAGNNRFVSSSTVYTDVAGTTVDGWGATAAGNPYGTRTACNVNSVSPAACGSAITGSFVIPTTTTTYTVNTTGVTANSKILLFPRTYTGELPGAPTCVTPAITSEPTISAKTGGTSFVVALASTAGQTCWDYLIMN